MHMPEHHTWTVVSPLLSLVCVYFCVVAFCRYRAGDVAVVYPRNEGTPAAEEAVAFFARYVGLPLSTRLLISISDGSATTSATAQVGAGSAAAVTAVHLDGSSGGPTTGTGTAILDEPDGPVHPFPAHAVTLEQLLRCHLDVQGTPRRSALELMACYASEGEQRNKLLELSGFASDTATLRAAERAARRAVDTAASGGAAGSVDTVAAAAIAVDGAASVDEDEKADADIPTAAEASGAYRLYVASEARTFAEVLADFPSVAMPLSALLELLPSLPPRHFSIASASCAPGAAGPAGAAEAAVATASGGGSDSPVTGAAGAESSAIKHGSASGQRLELCVGLVQYATPLRRRKTGVCSGFLSALPVGGTVYVGIRKGTFTPPWPLPPVVSQTGAASAAGSPTASTSAAELSPDFKAKLAAGLAVPLILVGPGTGIAPMRALWQERAAAIRCFRALGGSADAASAGGAGSPTAVAPCRLFYGCRNAQSDWLFGREAGLEALPSGALTAYDAAFSRPTAGPDGTCLQARCEPAATFAEPSAGDAQATLRSAGSLSVPLASATWVCWSTDSPLAAASTPQPLPSAATASAVAARVLPVTYVQHRIAAPEHAAAVADAIVKEGAVVFISGSAKRMPTDVAAALKELLAEHGGLTSADAAAVVSGMERSRRLVTEAWS